MSIVFANTTLTTVMTLVSVPFTAGNYAAMQKILTDIQAINGGVLVAKIETLVAEIQAIETSGATAEGLAATGMIRADLVEWKHSAANGAVARYHQLMSRLYALIGLPNPRGSGISMVRSDRYSLANGGGGINDDWSYITW